MKREFEGTTRLQSLGICEGIKASSLRVGDERVFNFGSTEKVVAIEPSKSGKTLKVTFEYIDSRTKEVKQDDIRTIGVNTIIVVTELNPVEEIKEEVKEIENSSNDIELSKCDFGYCKDYKEGDNCKECSERSKAQGYTGCIYATNKQNIEIVQEAITEVPLVKETEKTTETKTTNNSIEFTVSEDTHTKTGAKIFVAKLTKKVEYKEFKAIENKIKSISGYYSRFKKGFIFKEEPTQLLNDTFNNSETSETDQQENNIIKVELKEVEPIEVNINNINAENFPISKEISQRENDGHWIFRTKERNHQQEILNYLQSFQDAFMNELNKLNDSTNIYNYKRWLNSFKKRYYENYYKRLRNDSSNPSWITTGRDGRSASKDRKYINRNDNLMRECCSLDEEFKKKLGNIKVKVRKENDKNFAEAVLSNKKEYEYKRVKKLINLSTVNNYFEGNNLVEKNCYITTVNGQEFYIINVWSRFVAVNSKGQEIGKASCQTLKDCKVILNYYLAEYEKSEQIAM